MSKRTVIEIRTPQFHRSSGEPTPSVPDDFAGLRKMSGTALREIGCRRWCDPGDDDWPHRETLFLFPAEWYPHIPAGYKLALITGEKFAFEPGETDDDIRGGMLAYGILVMETRKA